MIPYTKKAYKLMHQGAIALAKVESNGIRMDVGYLDKTIETTGKKIIELEKELRTGKVAKEWKKMFGRKMKFGSPDQLGKVLFDGLGYESVGMTAGGDRYKTDEKALAGVEDPFVKDYLKLKKLQKVHVTYLKGIRNEIVDGLLHPFFNLHTVRTFRSSSSNPNFQNIPVRDPEIGRMVRQAFIPRKDSHLVEVDYSGIEVGIAACYHKDPRMLEYIADDTKDMHRDMATECFLLPKDEMVPRDDVDKARIKRIRYCGKNMFVFPQFYGDYYIDCARSLWDAAEHMELKLRDGTPLREHLRRKGITELGELDPKEKAGWNTFERHLQEVEKSFWNERFPVYNQWKKDWVQEYFKKGWLKTLTGFICQGALRRNQIVNYPIQGSAFHCLLQSLITLVNKELRRLKMKSKVVGQIHDSILADVPAVELDQFLQVVNHVTTVLLLEKFPWIIVPMEIEAEVTPLNGCWADKQEVKIA